MALCHNGPVADRIVQLRKLTSSPALSAHLEHLGLTLEVDPEVNPGGVLARSLELGRAGVASNRFATLPMEGWDGTADGRPTELVERRWFRFGASGAGLIWGGEAFAVVPEGRANPNQLCLGPTSVADLTRLRRAIAAGRRSTLGTDDGVVVGLQLTHSGRWSRPHGAPAPRTAYAHPVLDARVGATAASILSDGELDDLIGHYVAAALAAAEAGFDFVDVKQCHGYLGHELLSGVDRPGPYGGDLEGRSRFITRVITEIRAAAPTLGIGTRLSAYDQVPFVQGPEGIGIPDPLAPSPYPSAFGGDGTGAGIDLTEVHQLLSRLTEAGVEMCCVTAASPYYNPHLVRPAYFPPSDGYLLGHDPLVELVQMVEVTRAIATVHAELVVVGSGLTYLQEHFGTVAQALVGNGAVDVVGLGRMALSYPTLPADLLAGRPLVRAQLCRTFSDCTTAPRNGLISGCYPIDEHYKHRPERVELAKVKRAAEATRRSGS